MRPNSPFSVQPQGLTTSAPQRDSQSHIRRYRPRTEILDGHIFRLSRRDRLGPAMCRLQESRCLEGLDRDRLVATTILSLELPSVNRLISQRKCWRKIVAWVSWIDSPIKRGYRAWEAVGICAVARNLPDCIPAAIKKDKTRRGCWRR